ncbi:hypothetical protein D1614_19610 [Maribellus luteus]|uniref:Uncharacterized protein n=1 Tax=Maribellus luteus TaxID=2305463 RepID=A0A399SV32_9BACT|nr:hypothetical protein D1614_19610 [Maribellus luteus]
MHSIPQKRLAKVRILIYLQYIFSFFLKKLRLKAIEKEKIEAGWRKPEAGCWKIKVARINDDWG